MSLKLGETEITSVLQSINGTGGTNDYNQLINQPQINGVPLVGNKTTEELGINVGTVDAYTKAETDALIDLKTSQAVAPKADKTYVDNQLATKVSTSSLDTYLSTKADKADTYTKSETDLAIDNKIGNKADTSYVNAQLSTKANISDTYNKEETDALIEGIETTFTSSLNTKADKLNTYTKDETNTAINNATSTKADTSYVDNQLDLKSDKSNTYTKEEVDDLVNNPEIVGDTLPIGSLTAFSGTTTPTNWLLCDGREVSREVYSQLFSVIGTSYGAGDGETTFNLPNLTFEGSETKNYIIKAKQSAAIVASVVDTLESSSTTDALSANQGRVLANKGLKPLWENDDTSKAFGSQDITLSSDNYDYLVWFYLEVYGTASQNRAMMSTMSLKGWSVALEHAYDGQVSGTANYYNTNWYRQIVRKSDTLFNVAECKGKRGTETGVVTNNIYCVPVAVYGGKF